MEPFFEDYLGHLQRLHESMMSSIEGLPQAALDWIPGPGMNSINVLVVHITGAERYWIGDVAAQEPSERDREAEFKAFGLNSDTLRRRLFDS